LGIVDILVPFLFAIFGLAIIAWLVAVAKEFVESDEKVKKLVMKTSAILFGPTPARADVERSSLPVRFSLERILPLLLWLLILLPMILLPVVLVLFPVLGIPWSRLMPVPP
jgi:hypothetical protein